MNPQLLNALAGLGFAFVVLMLMGLIIIVSSIVTHKKWLDEDAQYPKSERPLATFNEQKVEWFEPSRTELAATIAAGIASNIGNGMHSTEIAADALRIADEIIAQSKPQSKEPPYDFTR